MTKSYGGEKPIKELENPLGGYMSVSIARKYIRAAPDPQESVQIDLSLDGDFEFQFTALVMNYIPLILTHSIERAPV